MPDSPTGTSGIILDNPNNAYGLTPASSSPQLNRSTHEWVSGGGTGSGATPGASDSGLVYANSYGAVGDGKIRSDGVTTAASTVYTSATGGFTTDDTGKHIVIAGAGFGGNPLITTVTYVNATTLTLTTPASTSTTLAETLLWRTDNRVAIEAALTALEAGGNGTLMFGSGVYVFSALQTNVAGAWTKVLPSWVKVSINLYRRSNIRIQGVSRGATVLAMIPAEQPQDAYIIASRDNSNITITDLSLYGSWKVIPPATGTISGGNTDLTLNPTILTLAASTSNFPSSGSVTIYDGAGTLVATVTYTGRTGNTLTGCAPSGSSATNINGYTVMSTVSGNEQMHGIGIRSTVGMSIARVNILGPRGDCIYMLGVTGLPSSDISVVDCILQDFRRDGIAVQHDSARVLISHCYILNSAVGGNSCIDFEPTSVGGIQDVEISDCYMQDDNATSAQVSLSGNSGTDPAERIRFTRNTVIGGCCQTTDLVNSEISSNIFIPANVAVALLFTKRTDNVRIANNIIVTPVGSLGGIKVGLLAGRYPNRLTIEGNYVEMNGAAPAIFIDTPQDDINIRNNTVVGGATAAATTGISVAGNSVTGTPHYNWRVVGNVIRNFVTGVSIKVYDANEPLTGLRVSDNDISDNRGVPAAVTGISVIRGINAARFATNVIICDNTIGDEVTTPLTITSTLIWYMVSGNRRGRGWYVMINGTPETVVSADIGSICSNAAGGAGTTFYVKESGAGTNTGWIAK